MPTFQFANFSEKDGEYPKLVADELASFFFATIGYPPLRCETITVLRHGGAAPMYVANMPIELILVTSEENRPWQLAFQLAHELGHLSARSDLRFPRADTLKWIEEALCHAHSMIAMRALAEKEGALQYGAGPYVQELLTETSSPATNAEWYQSVSETLAQATDLTLDGKLIGRHLFDRVAPERIVADNRLLLSLPVGIPLADFLQKWSQLSGLGESVPKVLIELTTPTA